MVKSAPILHALALGALLPAAGCSLLLVRPPPEPDASTGRVECSPSSIAPGADVVLSLTAAVAGALYYTLAHLDLSHGPNRDHDEGSNAGYVVTMAGAASPFIASAVYGFHQKSECRVAKARVPRCDPGTGLFCGPTALTGRNGAIPPLLRAAPPEPRDSSSDLRELAPERTTSR